MKDYDQVGTIVAGKRRVSAETLVVVGRWLKDALGQHSDWRKVMKQNVALTPSKPAKYIVLVAFLIFVFVGFADVTLATTACTTPNLLSTSFIQQTKWEGYQHYVFPGIGQQVQTIYDRVNNQVNLRKDITDNALKIVNTVYSVKGAMGIQSMNNQKLGMMLAGTGNSALTTMLGDTDPVWWEIQNIWVDALSAASSLVWGNPEDFAVYCGSQTVGSVVNVINTFALNGLTDDINTYTVANSILFKYYSFGMDLSLIASAYGYNYSPCTDELCKLSKFISLANHDIRINNAGLSVDDQKLITVVNSYISDLNSKFRQIEPRIIYTKPDLYGPDNGVSPSNIVFSWSGRVGCENPGELSYNLEIHEGSATVFNAENEVGLIATNSYSLHKDLKANTTYWWAVFPRNANGFWNTDVNWKSFTTGTVSSNSQPIPSLVVTPSSGTTATGFNADGHLSTDPDGDSLQFTFDWGDGSGFTAWSSSPLATHQYGAANLYNITMVVRDSSGAESYATKSVTITAPVNINQPPTVIITGGPSGSSTETTPALTYSGSDSDGSIAGFYRVIDSVSQINGTQPNSAYYSTNTTFVSAPLATGAHTFYVRAKDNQGGLSPVVSRSFSVFAPSYSSVVHDMTPANISLKPGDTTSFNISFQNMSTIAWSSNPSDPNYVELRSVSSNGSPSASWLYPGDGIWIDSSKMSVTKHKFALVAGSPENQNGWFIFQGKVPATAAVGSSVKVYFKLWNPASGYFGATAMTTVQVVAKPFPPPADDIPPTVEIYAPVYGESVSLNVPYDLRFYATDNAGLDAINVFSSTDGGTNFDPLQGCVMLSGNTISCIWTPTSVTNTAAIKVKAYDLAGNIGEKNVNFRVSSGGCQNIPSTPNLNDPGTFTENNWFGMNWQRISDATSYTLQESLSPGYATITAEYAYYGAESTSATIIDKANGTYYYRLKAKNYCGESSWSKTVELEVRVNTAPNVPSNPSPANGAIQIGRTPTLHWSGGDPDGVADYNIEFGTNPSTISSIQGYGSGNAYNTNVVIANPLEAGTVYYWRVKAQDNKSIVAEGPIWSFTTAYNYPDLTITAVTLSGIVMNGSSVTANVTIMNQGNYASSGGKLRFFQSTIPGATTNEYTADCRSLPAINPGESITINEQITLQNITAGLSYLVSAVESGGVLVESNTNNNTFNYTISYTDITGPTISYFDFRWPKSNTFKTNAQTKYVYTVADDIGVAGMDFYYSTDNGNSWNAVATNIVITNGGSASGYDWTIPASTPLNSAFKVKIVAKDASGNTSSSILGPYTIVDGSSPTVNITSPHSFDIWNGGSMRNITWAANSPNGIMAVRLYFCNANSVEMITQINSNPGTYAWTVPIMATSSGRIKIWVLDNNNNSIEAWSDYFTVLDTSPAPPAPWHMPVNITSSQNNSRATIATDSIGNLHLVYLHGSPDTGSQKIYYQKKSSGTWSAAVQIYDYTGINGISSLKLALDASNRPHVSWINPAYSELYYVNYSGTVWSSPILVSDNGFHVYEHSMAFDSNSNLHFVWGTNSICYHRIEYQNYSWSNINVMQGISRGGYSNTLKMGTNGYMHYVFTDWGPISNSLKYLQWNGTTWSSPFLIASTINYSDYPYKDIVVENNNKIHLVVRIDGGAISDIKYYVFNASSIQLTELIMQKNNFSNPQLMINSNGYLQLVWSQGSQSQILHMQRTLSGWSGLMEVTTATTRPVYEYSVSSVLYLNALHVVWTSGYSNPEITYNYADVSLDVVPPVLSLTMPSTGSILSIGSTSNISWAATDNSSIANISLKYTTDYGLTYTSITSGLANTGSYIWTVPNILSDSVQVIATATDLSGNSTIANTGTFRIADLTGPTTSIIAPAGGETWYSGTTHNMTWTAIDTSGVSGIDIDFSPDNGATWHTEAIGLTNSGTYAWTAPRTNSSAFLFKIIATDGNHNVASVISNNFSVAIANTPPDAPYSPIPVIGTVLGAITTTLQWQGRDLDNDALTYDVFFGTTNPPTLTASRKTTASHTVTLLPNMTYYWKVTASDGKATTSSPVWSFISSETINTPVGLSATHLSFSSIKLGWTDNSSNEDGFKIARKIGVTGSYTEIATVAANTVAYSDIQVAGHTEYVYRISAYKGVAHSGFSNEAGAVTDNTPPGEPVVVAPVDNAPDLPLNVMLSWTGSDPDGDALSYDVYFGAVPNPPLVASSLSGTTCSATALSFNKMYFWRIVAKDPLNATTESQVWSFRTQQDTAPATPAGLVATSISTGQIDLSWSDNSGNEQGFKVERKTTAAGSYQQMAVATDPNYSDVTGIVPGGIYYYRVRAYNSAGNSAYSDVATVTIAVTPVNNTPTISSLVPLVLNEDAGLQAIGLSGISAGGEESQVLTVTATSSNTGLIPTPTVVYASPSSTGSLSFTPVANANGTATITVTVNDGQAANNIAVQIFLVTVNAVNDAPTLTALSPLTINEDAGLQTVGLSGITAGSGESQTLIVTATSSNTALIPNPTVTYSSPGATGSLGFTPVANASGAATITVTVNDGQAANNSAVQTFLVTVNAVNDPPTLEAIGNVTINQDAGVQTVGLSGIAAGGGENQTLTVTAVSSNPELIPNPTVTYLSPDVTGSLAFTPMSNAAGTATITVIVDDGEAAANIIVQTFLVTVGPFPYVLWTRSDNGRASLWQVDPSLSTGPGQLKRSVNLYSASGIGAPWQASSYTHVSATEGYLLWTRSDNGRAVLWQIDPSLPTGPGQITRAVSIYSASGIGALWQASSYTPVSATEGYVLWTRSDNGRAALWQIDPSLPTGPAQLKRSVNLYSASGIGAPWQATSYTHLSATEAYVLWTRSDNGKAALWQIDPSLPVGPSQLKRSVLLYSASGIGAPWLATSYAHVSATEGYVLWTRSDSGKAALWQIDPSLPTGPSQLKRSVVLYSASGVGAAWQATALAITGGLANGAGADVLDTSYNAGQGIDTPASDAALADSVDGVMVR